MKQDSSIHGIDEQLVGNTYKTGRAFYKEKTKPKKEYQGGNLIKKNL